MPSTQQIVDLLNDLVRISPDAAHTLCEHRVPCGQEIVDHPQIVPFAGQHGGPLSLGLIGVLGGITRLDGQVLYAHFDDTTERLVRFSCGPHREILSGK